QFTTSFSFAVGTTHFAPGTYTVQPADDYNLGTLKISNGRKAAIMMVIPKGIPANEPKDNELTFERFGDGDGYVLTQIWDATDQSAMEPSTTAALLKHEPRTKVAERLTVPFIKVS